MATDLIAGYCAHLRSQSASDQTISDRRRTLTVLDRDLPYGLESACADELVTWLWRDGLSAGSRQTYYGAMSGFFRWAVQVGILDWDPTEHITRPKVPARLPRPVTDEQLADLLGRAVDPYRTWCLLAAYAGLRCLEISRLHREHITEQAITVLRGKGDRPRVVPTHPAIWAVVSGMPAGPVTDRDAHKVSIHFVLYANRTLGMPGVSLHRLRHWFASQIMERQGNLRVVQELLGHASPATTAIYTAVSDRQRTAGVALLPTLSDMLGTPESG